MSARARAVDRIGQDGLLHPSVYMWTGTGGKLSGASPQLTLACASTRTVWRPAQVGQQYMRAGAESGQSGLGY